MKSERAHIYYEKPGRDYIKWSKAFYSVSISVSQIDFEMILQEKTDLQEGAIIEEKMSPENSDYDSADSYTDEEQNIKIRSKASDLDDQSHSDTGSVILERQEGDGQESVPSKKVDDDEDKKNPQYIPKKGTFYEHDDRTVDDDE